MFEADAGQRQVNFSWSSPPVSQQNGLITNYTLSCSPSPSSLPLFPSQSGPLTVEGFSQYTSYSCSVVANNGVGSGPPANINFTTQEDCKNDCLLKYDLCLASVVLFTSKISILLLLAQIHTLKSVLVEGLLVLN